MALGVVSCFSNCLPTFELVPRPEREGGLDQAQASYRARFPTSFSVPASQRMTYLLFGGRAPVPLPPPLVLGPRRLLPHTIDRPDDASSLWELKAMQLRTIEEFYGVECKPQLRLYLNFEKPATAAWTWEVFCGVWWRPGLAVSREGWSSAPEFLLKPSEFHTSVTKVRGRYGSVDLVQEALFTELEPILTRWFDAEIEALARERPLMPLRGSEHWLLFPLVRMEEWKKSCCFGVHWQLRALLEKLGHRVEHYLRQRFADDYTYLPPISARDDESGASTYHASWC